MNSRYTLGLDIIKSRRKVKYTHLQFYFHEWRKNCFHGLFKSPSVKRDIELTAFHCESVQMFAFNIQDSRFYLMRKETPIELCNLVNKNWMKSSYGYVSPFHEITDRKLCNAHPLPIAVRASCAATFLARYFFLFCVIIEAVWLIISMCDKKSVERDTPSSISHVHVEMSLRSIKYRKRKRHILHSELQKAFMSHTLHTDQM